MNVISDDYSYCCTGAGASGGGETEKKEKTPKGGTAVKVIC